MTWRALPGKNAAFTLTQLPPSVLEGVKHKQGQAKGHPVTIVRHDLGTYEQLREHGLMLPSPLVHYHWPGRFTPRAHQYATAEHFVHNRKCFCLNGLGTGKTLSAVWASDYLIQEAAVRRVLVVAPLSICEHVWERELFQTLMHRRAAVLKGDRQKKRRLAADTRLDYLIVNPESLEIIEDSLPEVDLVIVDEFTKFKNAKAKRWKALKRITQNTRLWLMSGTPAPQSPMDAYGPLKLVNPKPPSYSQWRDMTMVQMSKFRWVPREGAEDTIAQALQPSVRYKREDCYDMPDVQEVYMDVDLSREQEQAIERFRQEAAAEIDETTIDAANAAAVLSKVLQVMSGTIYGEDAEGNRQIHHIKADPLFEAVEEVVEQADTPVLVFVPFRAAADAIYAHLDKAGYAAGKITGGTSHGRAELFDQVQAGTLDALVAVAGTMSHGLTLTGSRYVLWALPPHSYEEYEQANGRVVRDGQKNDVVIYHLVQNRLAKDLITRLKSKAQLQEAVLNLITGGEHGGE
jgi:SNF2 family DNA or RNA helicase